MLLGVHSGSPARRSNQPPLPLPVLLLLQCKSLMMMCCRGNGWRWAAPRAVGGSQPLSSVGGICRAHPSPSFWKEQEADCFWEGVGVGELSPLLPAASLGIALFVSLFLPSFVFCFTAACSENAAAHGGFLPQNQTLRAAVSWNKWHAEIRAQTSADRHLEDRRGTFKDEIWRNSASRRLKTTPSLLYIFCWTVSLHYKFYFFQSPLATYGKITNIK